MAAVNSFLTNALTYAENMITVDTEIALAIGETKRGNIYKGYITGGKKEHTPDPLATTRNTTLREEVRFQLVWGRPSEIVNAHTNLA